MCAPIYTPNSLKRLTVKKAPPFHLRLSKSPDDFDLAIGLFRKQELAITVQQMKVSKNKNDLPVDQDIRVDITVYSVERVIRSNNTLRIGGLASLCLKEWSGRRYCFVFDVDVLDRTGLGAIWLE